MTLMTLFISSYMMGFSGAMMPGPLLTVTIQESYRRGFKAGPLIVLGHAILELILVVGLTMGLYVLLINPFFKGAVALIGGLVLLWMGSNMFKGAWDGKITLPNGEQSVSRGIPPVLAGIVISLANPFWLIWWATIGLAYITQALEIGVIGLGVFLAGHLLADMTWYSLVSFAVVGGKKVLRDKVYQNILLGCGVFLFGLGLYFIFSASRFVSL